MTQDIDLQNKELLEESEQASGTPPLCLVHYFGASGQGPPPPSLGHIAERDGNLLILEFAPSPKATKAKQQNRKWGMKAADALFLLLLLASAIGCIAAFRF